MLILHGECELQSDNDGTLLTRNGTVTRASRFLRRRRKFRRHLCRAVDLATVDTATAEFRFEAKRQVRLIAEADAKSDIMYWLETVSLLDEEN